MTKLPNVPVSMDRTAAFLADVTEVVARRCLLISFGGREGMAEARSMVSEKMTALAHVNTRLVMGAYGFTPASVTSGIFGHYAGLVWANRRRLAK